jgi:cobalt/nickel transport system permease protein
MHIPDGYINLGTSAGAAVAAAGGLGAALRQTGRYLKEKQVPIAGLTAAFIFAVQMLNFPVAAGTTGHLLGGALAAILLGPWLGVVAVSVVVIVQALLFADGGITALGLNVLNMAVLTVAVGWPLFRLGARILPGRGGVLAATMVAAWASVVVSAIGFAVQYAVGGTVGIDPTTVFRAMVGVHALIGIGEGIISALTVAAVVSTRPDLVAGLEGLRAEPETLRMPGRAAIGGFVAAGFVVAAALVVFVAPFAAPHPDGLERVAIDQGFAEAATEHPVGGPLADYGVAGIDHPWIGTALAGLVGVGVTYAVGLVLVSLARRRRGTGTA